MKLLHISRCPSSPSRCLIKIGLKKRSEERGITDRHSGFPSPGHRTQPAVGQPCGSQRCGTATREPAPPSDSAGFVPCGCHWTRHQIQRRLGEKHPVSCALRVRKVILPPCLIRKQNGSYIMVVKIVTMSARSTQAGQARVRTQSFCQEIEFMQGRIALP